MARKPLPKEIKILKGTYEKRYDNLAMPEFARGNLQAPDFLSPIAQKEYERIAALLQPLGVFRESDESALTIYASAYARWREAEQHLAKEGAVIEAKDGSPKRNPWLLIQSQAEEQMRKFLSEFGLTPSSRQKIKAEKTVTNNPFAAFTAQEATNVPMQ